MVRKGKLAIFERSSISETEEAPPTKIGVHAFDINLYLHEFFEPIPIDFFLMTMDRKGKLAVFEDSSISKTGEAPPTKIGVHV